MPHNERILQLLENLMDSGASPEEACSDCPELLGELKERWEQCRRIDAKIDALLGPAHASSEGDKSPRNAVADFPWIAGYEVIAVLGRGGMGIVYKARHLELDRVVALKMLLAGVHAGRTERARFMREARAVAGLPHPGIVRVFDVGEFEGCPFFTMEYFDGGTLADSLQGMPQRASRAAAIVLSLAEAIESAHQSGVIHRDLKPANVLVAADGMPRISDFGLALSLQSEGTITMIGTRLGTPSYMAPEQALGRSTVGPRTDVYSLGAILYEMLTGRPPFRGESPADTERQLLGTEVVPPSRLNARVPRDLETICLKCLRKDPLQRYASAAQLADEIRSFQRGDPILARPCGKLNRALKWTRRHPAVATAFSGVMVIIVLLASATGWLLSTRASTLKSVNENLSEALQCQRQARWPAADAALDRAILRLGNLRSVDLRNRLNQAQRDSELAERLQKIHLDECQNTSSDGTDQVAGEYAAAFNDAGIGIEGDPPQRVADLVKRSTISATLIDALDDWGRSAPRGHRLWPQQVAVLADEATDPAGNWRREVREKIAGDWRDPSQMTAYMETADVQHQSVSLLVYLAAAQLRIGGNPLSFYQKIQAAHPDDFWANFALANALTRVGNAPMSVRYYQAAVALRPKAALVHYSLGKVLWAEDRRDEAIPEYREATRCNPVDAGFAAALGAALVDDGHFAEAIAPLQQALRSDPANLAEQFDLGESLHRTGADADASPHFRAAIGLAPQISAAQHAYRKAFLQHGEFDKLQTAWNNALKDDASDFQAREGYAELCLFSRSLEHYQAECAYLLKTFGSSTDPAICCSIAGACLLAPESDGNQKQTDVLVERAVADSPADPTCAFLRGLADYRAGRFQAAADTLRRDFPPSLHGSPHIVLAMAIYQLGQKDLARKTLENAMTGLDWTTAKALTRQHWTSHVLCREAEQLLGIMK